MPYPRLNFAQYRPAWRDEYAAIESDLSNLLGQKALRIDHIGSTAVPGLCAKDIIDVQVTVAQLSSFNPDIFISASYICWQGQPFRSDHVPSGLNDRGEDWQKLFFMQRQGERRCNIHVRQHGRANQRYALLVRDFLRSNPQIANAYGDLKLRLAANLADPLTYPDVKDPVSDIIYLAAEQWARSIQGNLSAFESY